MGLLELGFDLRWVCRVGRGGDGGGGGGFFVLLVGGS